MDRPRGLGGRITIGENTFTIDDLDREDGPDGDRPVQLHLHPAEDGVLHQAGRHVQGPPLLRDHAPGLRGKLNFAVNGNCK